MLPPTQTLNIDVSSSSQKPAANTSLLDGSPQYELDFADLLQAPHQESDENTLELIGNELPLNGITLPFAEGQDQAGSAPITGTSDAAEQLELLLADAGEQRELLLSVEPGIEDAVAQSGLPSNISVQATTAKATESADLNKIAVLDLDRIDNVTQAKKPTAPRSTPILPANSTPDVNAELKNAVTVQVDLARSSRDRVRPEGTGTELQQHTDFQRDIPARIPGVPGLESLARQNLQRQLMREKLGNAEDIDGARKIEKQLTSLSNSISQGGQSHLRETTASGRPAHFVSTSIEHPVLDKSWGDALQDKVSWMTNRKIQSAEIRLNPAELGPIRVQVLVEDDAATLIFTAQHNLTRDAIEQALPRLREMLNENGLALAGSTVNDSSDGELLRDDRTDDQTTTRGEQPTSAEEEQIEMQLVQNVDSSALVDTFA